MDLYKETQELMEMRKAMEAEEIPEQAINDTLVANSEEFDSKAVALYQVTDEMEYELLAIKSMIDTLQARKAAIEHRKETMRRVLLGAMLSTGITQIKCPWFTISTKKGVSSVIIDDEEALPDEYVAIEVVQKPDKKAIKEAIAEGKTVAGAHMSEPGTILQVKKK